MWYIPTKDLHQSMVSQTINMIMNTDLVQRFLLRTNMPMILKRSFSCIGGLPSSYAHSPLVRERI
jgi:hypothetical protein